MTEKINNQSIEKNEWKEYTIPLKKEWKKVPRYKRANKAIKAIKEFLVRHMKIYNRDLNKIKIDKYLNEYVWRRGIKKPPRKIVANVMREGELIKVQLSESEMPEKLKFKKIKLERREQKAREIIEKKKKEAEEKKKKQEKEETEEKKKEAEEKKASVREAGKELEKKIAKQTKHQAKISKQPKHQMRKALEK